MKKTIITTILIGITIFTISSQTSFRPGIKLGYNNTKIESISDGNRNGFYAGLFGELYFENMSYAIQPEISYSQQGTENYKQDFFVIAFVNKIYLSQDEFYFLVGASKDIKINGPKEIIGDDAYVEVKLASDYSAFGGFGYHFPFGLGIEARAKFSIKDIGSDDFGNSSGKNSIIQVGLTYKFDLEKWF